MRASWRPAQGALASMARCVVSGSALSDSGSGGPGYCVAELDAELAPEKKEDGSSGNAGKRGQEGHRRAAAAAASALPLRSSSRRRRSSATLPSPIGMADAER